MSININGIRGKKLELSSFLEIEDPDIIAIQETNIDRNILTSELFQDNINYDVYRNDRTLNGGGVILLVNKTYNSMPLYNLENGSE
jgi:exonuclease III